MRPTPILFCLASLIALAPPAHAVGQLADVTLYDREARQSLPIYSHNGEYFVAGKPGSEYRIQIRNQGGGDLLSVVSVDGVNVVTGETAHWRQGGYVLGPWDALGIDGWRKSLSRTAAFCFTRVPDSYAARTGRPDNVGVVGVALFQRRAEVTPMPQLSEESPGRRGEARADSAPAPETADTRERAGLGQQAASPTERLGTGHGRSEHSPARYTTFDRATETPVEVITIRYDSRERLIAMGIIPEDRPLPVAVNPFPGSFVADPPH